MNFRNIIIGIAAAAVTMGTPDMPALNAAVTSSPSMLTVASAATTGASSSASAKRKKSSSKKRSKSKSYSKSKSKKRSSSRKKRGRNVAKSTYKAPKKEEPQTDSLTMKVNRALIEWIPPISIRVVCA